MMVGMPGSGKTYLAASLGPTIVSPDYLREWLTGDMSDQSQNAKVFRMAHERTRAILKSGDDVVFDATNVTARARAHLLHIAEECGAEPWAIFMATPVNVCHDRNRSRDRRVPTDVMVRMWTNLGTSSPDVLRSEGWDVAVHSGVPGEDE